MKKRLGLLLTMLLVLSLAACGQGSGGASTQGQGGSDAPLEREDNSAQKSETAASKSDENEKSVEGTGIGGTGYTSISDVQSATDVVWGKQDDVSRQEIIDAARAEGMEVSFGDDGSMTITDADGNVFVQNPDGSWMEMDEDGTVSQLGGSWPSNEFTKLIPDPGFEMLGLSASDEEFTAAFQGAGVEDVRAYAAKVMAKGFTIDAEEQDQEIYGVTIYTYAAYNEDGYRVEISYTNGTIGVTISK